MPCCGFCVQNQPMCLEQGGIFSCTRLLGHDGPHVACGGTVHGLRVWETPDKVFLGMAEALDYFATRRPRDCNCNPVKSEHSYQRKVAWRDSV